MKKVHLVLLGISFSLFSLTGFSQLSKGGLPLSFQNPKALTAGVPVEIMPLVNVISLIAEDSVNDQYKDIPWRFGENIPVNYGPGNSGRWDNLPNGDRVWRLGIKCHGAYTINLTFDNYRLPPGATLFVYNIDKTDVIGAFTDMNNRDDSVFATTLVKGSEIVIEYFEPASVSFPGQLHLNRVTHGYRDALGYVKSFGSSGSCNNNVHCPEAADWQNQVRSACMLVTGGNGFCSGSLVNNTSQNGIPYILTANHCYSNPANWVFWFNWESSTCPNPSSSPAYNSISGATLRARYSDSDFCLVEMSSTPPPGFNVYYAGWSKIDTAATSGVGVHHPSGDIKKISYSLSPYAQGTWSGTPPNSHWQVFWNDGVTEGGSSGSPIFDQNHRLVGQLHGGPSSCTSSQKWDFYGKFSMSWDHGTTPATRLKEWLDPTNLGIDTINGFDPNIVPVVHTLPANALTVTSATLNGTVNPNGYLTNYHFDWGTTSAFGDSTAPQSAGSGSATVPVNATVPGLSAGTEYFFRLVGNTASEIYIGDTLSFITLAPALNVSPPIQNVGTPAGVTNFIVTSNINWTVTSGSGWCTVTPSGTGNDTIFATFTENTAISPRTAIITVSGPGVASQTVNVTQEGVPVSLNVTPPNRDVSHLPGETTFIVTSNTAWTVTGNAGWISLTPSGTGNDTIHVTVNENTAITARIATITVSAAGTGSVDVSVTQEAAPVLLTVTPLSQNVSFLSGDTTFSVTSNTGWTVSSDAAWCTVTPSGTGNGTIVANYLENATSQSRTATISVTVSTLPVQMVTLNQGNAPNSIGYMRNNDIQVLPNPTKGRFSIIPADGELSDMEVKVFDMDGRMILKQVYRGGSRYEADLSSSAAGSYEVVIRTGKGLTVRKLVIIK